MDHDPSTDSPLDHGTEAPDSQENEALAQSAKVIQLIRNGALFALDSALNMGGLDSLPVLPRVALALYQFDFATVHRLLPDVPDADIRSAIAGVIFFTSTDDPSDDTLPPSVELSSNAAAHADARALVAELLSHFEESTADVLSNQVPTEWKSALHRYIYLRLQIYFRPTVGSLLENIFPTDSLTDGELFCLVLYHIECGRHNFVKVVLDRMNYKHRMSGHLFYLLYRANLENNLTTATKGWLLNARTCKGIDERLDERVFSLFGIMPDAPINRDIGLRALREVGHSDAFAVRRGQLRHLPRPDSPHGESCLAYADQDLARDIAAMREALTETPLPKIDDVPPDEKTTSHGYNKRFLFVAPPKSKSDIGLAASALTKFAVVWFDCWSEIMANVEKLGTEASPDGTATLDMAYIRDNVAFFRSTWQKLEEDRLGLPPNRAEVHIVTNLHSLSALKLLWPGAKYSLCLPNEAAAEVVSAAGLRLDEFDHVLFWRRPAHVARILATLGVPRRRRRAVALDGQHLRALLYPV